VTTTCGAVVHTQRPHTPAMTPTDAAAAAAEILAGDDDDDGATEIRRPCLPACTIYRVGSKIVSC